MKKGRFLWSAHRITEKQKAGKARNIKEKQLKNSRNTVSKQLVVHHSSQNDNYLARDYKPQKPCVSGVFFTLEFLWDVQKRDENLWICSKYAARMHQKSQQLHYIKRLVKYFYFLCTE